MIFLGYFSLATERILCIFHLTSAFDDDEHVYSWLNRCHNKIGMYQMNIQDESTINHFIGVKSANSSNTQNSYNIIYNMTHLKLQVRQISSTRPNGLCKKVALFFLSSSILCVLFIQNIFSWNIIYQWLFRAHLCSIENWIGCQGKLLAINQK